MKFSCLPGYLPPLNNASSRSLKWWIGLVIALTLTPLYGATILVFGDSLSAGYGISTEDAWPKLLEKKLLNEKIYASRKMRVVNASISGETTAGGRVRLPALIERHKPNIVILELGANDGLRGLSLSAMKDNLNAMLQLTKKSGAKTVLVGMRLPPNYGAYANDFNATFSALASQNKTPFVPFLLDGLADQPTRFQPDGLHPTRDAQPLLLDNVWPTLQSVLR